MLVRTKHLLGTGFTLSASELDLPKRLSGGSKVMPIIMEITRPMAWQTLEGRATLS
jgi:hypothetical protein